MEQLKIILSGHTPNVSTGPNISCIFHDWSMGTYRIKMKRHSIYWYIYVRRYVDFIEVLSTERDYFDIYLIALTCFDTIVPYFFHFSF